MHATKSAERRPLRRVAAVAERAAALRTRLDVRRHFMGPPLSAAPIEREARGQFAAILRHSPSPLSVTMNA
jgi:hypothetical protein